MPNKENSKEKILVVYDIFRNEVLPDDLNTAVTMSDIKEKISDFLVELNGDVVENKDYTVDRKTIYKILAAINCYVEVAGLYVPTDENDKWIYQIKKNKYSRKKIKDELSGEDFIAISDAIRTAPFVSKGTANNFFSTNKALSKYNFKVGETVYFHSKNYSTTFNESIRNIKIAKAECKMVEFDYGYLITTSKEKNNDKLFGIQPKKVMPATIDFKDGFYYFWAFEKSQIKNFRIDRMANVRVTDENFEPIKNLDEILKENLEDSVNSYATNVDKQFIIEIKSKEAKATARAFSVLKDNINVVKLINGEKEWEKGTIRCLCYVKLSPAFYMRMFNLITYDLETNDEELRVQIKIEPDDGGKEIIEGIKRYTERVNGFLSKNIY